MEADARRLGLGDAVPVSAEHGDGALSMLMAPPRLTRVAGLNALYEVLQSHAALGFEEQESIVRRALAESESGDLGLVDAMEVAVREWEAGARHAERGQREEHEPFYLAVLGRPNVGKSTLINRLLRQDRMVTGPMPGVTRDAIAVDWQFRGRPVRLVDTAGVRRAKTVRGRHSHAMDLPLTVASVPLLHGLRPLPRTPTQHTRSVTARLRCSSACRCRARCKRCATRTSPCL